MLNLLRSIFSISKLGNRIITGQADSGLNIDHIYQGIPAGRTPFGKFIDKILLNLPAAKATRLKKAVLIKIISNEIENNLIRRKKTRILDLASGPSRYIVDLLNEKSQNNTEALCLDNDRASINFGKAISGNKPIRYMRANIYRLEPLKRFAKRAGWLPNVILVTGFFEMLNDEIVRSFIRDSYQHLDNEGLIVFTSQRNNPSKKLMETMGRTQDGNSWRMNFREPQVLRRWLFEEGFKDIKVSVDRFGIYEFCTGRKYTS